MVSEPEMNNREGASISEQKSTVTTTTQKGSRSSPGSGRSTTEQMDNDGSVHPDLRKILLVYQALFLLMYGILTTEPLLT